MSYILDALKKSDAERKRGTAPLPSADRGPVAPTSPVYAPRSRGRLLVAVGIVPVLLVAAWVWIPGSEPGRIEEQQPGAISAPTPASVSREKTAAPFPNSKNDPPTLLPAPTNFADAPFLWELPQSYQQAIGDLSVSIHVYAESADRRILFLNDKEVHSGEQIKQGPRVENIVPEGVILSYEGRYFKLPRPR